MNFTQVKFSTESGLTQPCSMSRKDKLLRIYNTAIEEMRNRGTQNLTECFVQTGAGDFCDRASGEQISSINLAFTSRDREAYLELLSLKNETEKGKWLAECESCTEEIDIRRVEARPFTRFCLDCQTEAEEKDRVRRK